MNSLLSLSRLRIAERNWRMNERIPSDGVLLAFDTSSSVGSVAVGRAGAVLAHAELEQQRKHASALIPAIRAVLLEADVDKSELDGIVVGEGPGSFTGVRVAAATAKGMVHALGLPLWAVSSLAATALSVGGHGIRYVLFDARSDRVYGACYGVGKMGMKTLVFPHAGMLREVLAGEIPAGAVFLGEGSHHHRLVIEAAGFEVQPFPVSYPGAKGLLRYLKLYPDTPSVDAVRRWEPRYIRNWRPGLDVI